MTARRRLTGSGPRVLWGSTQQVQGFNGSNAAQPDCPQGSTLTFQLYAGVPWVHGLRHGVTMHPRGRHLREGRIPWSHGKSHNLAREQQPQHNHWWEGDCPSCAGKAEENRNQHNHYYYHTRYECRREVSNGKDNDGKANLTVKSQDTRIQGETDVKSECDGRPYNNHNYNYNYNHYYDYHRSPLRGVNQRSSTATVSANLGEPIRGDGPKADVHNTQCESWLSPFGTRSSLVSQRDGRKDIEVRYKKNYSSVRLETTTTIVGQYNYHSSMRTNSRDASVNGVNYCTK